MNKNPIDRLFRQKLKGSVEPYPAHLWEGVSQSINSNGNDGKGRALWIRWSALGLFLLFAIPIGYFSLQWMGGEATVAEAHISNEVANMDGNENNTDISDVDNSLTSATNEHTESVATQDVGEVNLSGLSGQTQEKTLTSKGLNTGSQDVLSGTQLTQFQNQQNTNSGNTSLPNNSISNQINSNNTGSITGSNAGRIEGGQQGSSSANPGGTTGGSEGSSSLRGKRELLNAEKCPALDRRTIIESAEEKKARNIREAVADIGSWTKRSFYGQWSVAMIYGPNVYFRELEPKGEEGLALANHRSDNERFVSAFTTGMEVRLKARKWSLHTGLHYAQINERNEYVIDEAEKTLKGIPTKGVLERSVVNRYKMLEVPVMVGYEVTRGPWALEVQAGANFGLNLSTDGEIFDEETLSYQDLASEEGSAPFKSNAGTALNGGLMLSYKTGYFSNVFIRPYYKQYLNPITNSDYGLEQKYSNVGIVAGYRIIL